MEERLEELVGQYELSVCGSSRIRGAYLLQTDRGLFLLQQTELPEGVLRRAQGIKEWITSGGFAGVDSYVLPRDPESICSFNGYGDRFLLKRWFPGKECEACSQSQLVEGAALLGKLQPYLRGWPGLPGETGKVPKETSPSSEEPLERKTRELTRAFRYVQNKKNKDAFERLFLETFPVYFRKAKEGEALWKEEAFREYLKEKRKEELVCHGSYSYHTILLGEEEAVTDWEKGKIGLPMEDLYHFLRKVMEKNHWNPELGDALLEAYGKETPLSSGDMKCLRNFFAYPDKYWKVVNQYYNHAKGKVHARNMEKLQRLLAQEEESLLFSRHILYN